MSRKPETRFRTHQVVPFLKMLKHTQSFPIQQKSICGDPDFLLCCHSKFVALELKKAGGKARKLQQFKLDQVVKRGMGYAFVASPDNWASVKRDLLLLDSGEEIFA